MSDEENINLFTCRGLGYSFSFSLLFFRQEEWTGELEKQKCQKTLIWEVCWSHPPVEKQELPRICNFSRPSSCCEPGIPFPSPSSSFHSSLWDKASDSTCLCLWVLGLEVCATNKSHVHGEGMGSSPLCNYSCFCFHFYQTVMASEALPQPPHDPSSQKREGKWKFPSKF